MADASKPPGDPPGPFPFSPQDAMTFMQKMWNPFGVPIPGFGVPGAEGAGGPAAAMAFPNPAMMFAALDPQEVERKIGELRIIENWLRMSLDMMQMSIKTLELQKASLEAMRGSQSAGGGPAEPPRKG
jgi:hypothetical protein